VNGTKVTDRNNVSFAHFVFRFQSGFTSLSFASSPCCYHWAYIEVRQRLAYCITEIYLAWQISHRLLGLRATAITLSLYVISQLVNWHFVHGWSPLWQARPSLCEVSKSSQCRSWDFCSLYVLSRAANSVQIQLAMLAGVRDSSVIILKRFLNDCKQATS